MKAIAERLASAAAENPFSVLGWWLAFLERDEHGNNLALLFNDDYFPDSVSRDIAASPATPATLRWVANVARGNRGHRAHLYRLYPDPTGDRPVTPYHQDFFAVRFKSAQSAQADFFDHRVLAIAVVDQFSDVERLDNRVAGLAARASPGTMVQPWAIGRARCAGNRERLAAELRREWLGVQLYNGIHNGRLVSQTVLTNSPEARDILNEALNGGSSGVPRWFTNTRNTVITATSVNDEFFPGVALDLLADQPAHQTAALSRGQEPSNWPSWTPPPGQRQRGRRGLGSGLN